MTPERFLSDYLAAQVRAQEQWAEFFAPVQSTFFRSGFRPFDPRKNVERARQERILTIADTPSGTEIVTTGFGEHHRLRYNLHRHEGGYSIDGLEMECGICSRGGGARPQCKICGGTGWKAF